jgi:hypothetical protein
VVQLNFSDKWIFLFIFRLQLDGAKSLAMLQPEPDPNFMVYKGELLEHLIRTNPRMLNNPSHVSLCVA